jgi:signal transduction histidine kinase/chemotaxis methyl-accepting protein methylase
MRYSACDVTQGARMATVSASARKSGRSPGRRLPPPTPVGGFFDRPDAWKELEDSVIAPLVREKQAGEVIRVWVPDAASGEDAYGVAMLLVERLEAEGKRALLTVFATDADEAAIARAREGVYPVALTAHVGSERRASFFVETDDGQRLLVGGRLRATVIFGTHDLLDDPPFSRIDLVCCARGLEHLGRDEQLRAFGLFRSALRAGGHLFLAGAKGVYGDTEAFLPVSRRWNIYRRFEAASRVSKPLIVCCDANLFVKWFTGGGALLAPKQSEVGSPLEDFALQRNDHTLVEDAKNTLRVRVHSDREVYASDGRWYARHISPHREGLLVTFSDIEAHKKAELAMRTLTAELEGRVDARTRNLKLLHETVGIANRARSFEQGLRDALERIRREFGWPIAHAWLLHEDGGTLVDTGAWSLPSRSEFARLIGASRRTLGEASLPWRAIRRGAPWWVSDVTAAPGFCRPTGELVAQGIRGALFVPIRIGQSIAGLLEFFTHENTEPPKLTTEALEEIGGQLGRVLERDRSERALHQMAYELLLAEERERAQLAADLHDDLGQLLALARMRVDTLLAEAPESGEALAQISEILGRANDRARTVMFRLSPPILRELGLVPAVRWLAESLSGPECSEIRVDAEGLETCPLSHPARLILFRCTRELLLNSVRHAHAKAIHVGLRRDGEVLSITVSDDGKGFPLAPSAARRHGEFGLFSVRERLSHLGGDLAVRSDTGAGTTATITFPVGPPAQ